LTVLYTYIWSALIVSVLGENCMTGGFGGTCCPLTSSCHKSCRN